MIKKIATFFVLISSTFLLASCSLPGLASNSNDDTIAITGGVTSEAQILGSIVAGMVEHYTDMNTTIINNLATTTINHQAMMNKDATISAARYTGTDLTTTLGLEPQSDPAAALSIVKREFQERYDQTYFDSYGFDNTYVFLVTKETAAEYNLEKVSDLAGVADQLVAGVDTAWITREGDGYDGFKATYNFEFQNILPMQIGLVYDAVDAGSMDIVLGYSTDGRIASYDLVMLEDDLDFFPPYDAAAVVDNETLANTPGLREAIEKLAGTIDTTKMQELNFEADNDLVEPSVVAERFLIANNYFEGE